MSGVEWHKGTPQNVSLLRVSAHLHFKYTCSIAITHKLENPIFLHRSTPKINLLWNITLKVHVVIKKVNSYKKKINYNEWTVRSTGYHYCTCRIKFFENYVIFYDIHLFKFLSWDLIAELLLLYYNKYLQLFKMYYYQLL